MRNGDKIACDRPRLRLGGGPRQASNVCLPCHSRNTWRTQRAAANAAACLPTFGDPARPWLNLGAFFGTVLIPQHCFEEGHRPPEAANGRGSVKSSRRKYYPAGWAKGGWAGWRFPRKGLTGSWVFARLHDCEAAVVSWGLASPRRAWRSGDAQQGGSPSRQRVTSNEAGHVARGASGARLARHGGTDEF